MNSADKAYAALAQDTGVMDNPCPGVDVFSTIASMLNDDLPELALYADAVEDAVATGMVKNVRGVWVVYDGCTF